MTTKVTVDAHAGWPVKVTTVQLNSDGTPKQSSDTIVPANTKQDFYIHSHMQLAGVKEMPREVQEVTQADVGKVSDVI